VGGTSRPIVVQTEAELSQVKVEFSDAGGREGSWKPIPDLKATATGFHWTLPKISNTTCRLRVTMVDSRGREHSDASDKDFAIEPGDGQTTVSNPPTKPPTEDIKEPLKLKTVLPDKVKGGTAFAWNGSRRTGARRSPCRWSSTGIRACSSRTSPRRAEPSSWSRRSTRRTV
jgi:hypothetical protein